MSHYSKYQGRSIGRIIHFLHCYCPYNVAEGSRIGNGKIYYGPKDTDEYVIATYEYGLAHVPLFKFVGEYEYCNQNQEEKMVEAIREGFGYPGFGYPGYDEGFEYLGEVFYDPPFSRQEITCKVFVNMNRMEFKVFEYKRRNDEIIDCGVKNCPVFALTRKEDRNPVEQEIFERAVMVGLFPKSFM